LSLKENPRAPGDVSLAPLRPDHAGAVRCELGGRFGPNEAADREVPVKPKPERKPDEDETLEFE
jgi:hypothetical protein